tara:strand:- start:348 stop:1055 length:708 start_codon:yes stop_codon:yes gene_type:complete
MKICLIKQPAGIGDVFFCQKIARYMMHHGYQVVWPLMPSISWVKDYIKDIHFPLTTEEFPGKDIYQNGSGFVIEKEGAFISTSTADLTHNDGKIMSSKYSMLGMDHDDWSKFFYFERNLDKENDLYYNILGLKDDDEFVFINNLYNTDIRDSNLISKDQFDLPVVELKIIDGFTLFDWCKVLEKAKKIYTINTAINYLIEVIDTSYDEYVIYAHDENNKTEIDYLFKKPHTMLCK